MKILKSLMKRPVLALAVAAGIAGSGTAGVVYVKDAITILQVIQALNSEPVEAGPLKPEDLVAVPVVE